MVRLISRRLVSIVFAVSAVAVPLGALAANVSFPVDTTVSFSGTGETITALAGSTADAFTVNTASATITVSAGTSRSTFRSVSKTFVIGFNTATATSTCTGSGDTLTVQRTGTTTFSLASSACTGGTAFQSITATGGGGSPSSPVSGPILAAGNPTSTAPFGAATVPPRVPLTSGGSYMQPVSRTSGITTRFAGDLQYGRRNSEEVRRLQKFLIEEGVYPEALITGNYLSFTRAAVERYHVKYCIARSGVMGYGRFGPASRAAANRILGL